MERKDGYDAKKEIERLEGMEKELQRICFRIGKYSDYENYQKVNMAYEVIKPTLELIKMVAEKTDC